MSQLGYRSNIWAADYVDDLYGAFAGVMGG